MGLRSWIIKKLIPKEVISFYIDQVKEEIHIKTQIKDVLQDEEIAQGVISYGDALYDRYQKKFWGQIGGVQKGLNFLGKQDQDSNNDLENIFDLVSGEENINLSKLIKFGLSNYMKGNNGNNHNNNNNPGVMT